MTCTPYLWDRSEPVEEDVAALERLLKPLAHDGRPLSVRLEERVQPERQARTA